MSAWNVCSFPSQSLFHGGFVPGDVWTWLGSFEAALVLALQGHSTWSSWDLHKSQGIEFIFCWVVAFPAFHLLSFPGNPQALSGGCAELQQQPRAWELLRAKVMQTQSNLDLHSWLGQLLNKEMLFLRA